MFEKEARTVNLWDVHECAYLVLGLTSDYAFRGEQKSLEGARKLADYLISELTATPPKKVGPDDFSAVMGTTGIDTAMIYLTEQTGDVKYRDFVINARKLAEWRLPIVKGRWGNVSGHAYAYMQECLAQVRLTEWVNDGGLWDETRGVFDFLLKGDGLVITGTCGDHECWHDTQSGTTNRAKRAPRRTSFDFATKCCGKRATRCTAISWSERSTMRCSRRNRPTDARCVTTPVRRAARVFRRRHLLLPVQLPPDSRGIPQMIYYGRADGVYVNQFTPSTATVRFGEGREVKLKQETDYPNSGRIVLTVESGGGPFTLYVRQPGWAKSAAVRVNGESAEHGLAITREWKAGDQVEVEFPMEWRLVKGRKAQAGRAAVMRGPQLFTYNPARNRDMKDLEPRLFTLDENARDGRACHGRFGSARRDGVQGARVGAGRVVSARAFPRRSLNGIPRPRRNMDIFPHHQP